MKLKRLGVIFTIIIISMMLILNFNTTYAVNGDEDGYSLGYVLFRDTKDGYIIGASNIDNENADGVWKLVSYNKDSSIAIPGEDYNEDKSIYCLKAGVGFVEQMDESNNRRYLSNVADYNYKVNLFEDKETTKTLLSLDNETYNKIVWIIDNMYVPIIINDSDTTAVKQAKESMNNAAKEKLLSQINTDNAISPKNVWEEMKAGNFTDEDIEVVQQLALWYYTNADETAYHKNTHTLYIGKSTDSFSNMYQERQDCANALYKWLITNADANYTHQQNTNIKATLWTNNANTNQPVVIVEKTIPEFDLSLRKRITSIKGVGDTEIRLDTNKPTADEINNIRNIKIDTSKLDNKADDNENDYTTTTAEYKHRKDPIAVDTGTLVTYTITIYNEGEIDGRATQIKDQIPKGLTFVEGKTEGYDYVVDANNLLTISEKEGSSHEDLKAYTGNGKLASKEIEVVCQVEQERGENETVLTNVAWIAKAYNALGVADRDSSPEEKPDVNQNNMSAYTGKNNQENLADENYYYKGFEDDDDFDKLVLPAKEKIFDLSLRKYITKVTSKDGTKVTNIEESTSKRNPVVDTSTLKTGTTATYKHRKDPVVVETGDLVTYNITVYNEGEKAGRATKIVDQLPIGLTFNKEETEKLTINSGYTFEYDEKNNKIIISETTGSSHENLSEYTGTGELASKTIQVVCNVTEIKGSTEKILTNIAYISEEYNAVDDLTITNQRYIENKSADRDSEPSSAPTEKQEQLNTNTIGYTGKDTYTSSDLANSNNYFKGKQDDDDFEKVKLLPDQIDLALRKFITGVNEKEITTRIPQVDTSTIKTNGTATYNHTKIPVNVQIGDIVTYTIRVYNEGGLDAYASEITDHLPEYLEYITSAKAETEAEKAAAEFNENYLWEVSADGRTISTKLCEKDKSSTYSTLTGIEREDTLLKAFDGGDTLDYIDVKVKCRVKKVEAETKITNIADITGMQDENGENVDTDRDSTIDNVKIPTDEELPNYKDDEINKPYVPGQEDDDDFEKLIVQIFDLALRKFITAVDDTAVTTRYPSPTMGEDGNIKYIHTKDPVGVSTGNLVTYTIRVYNEGEISGYAKEVTDNLPEGLKYLPENSINKRYGWIMRDEKGDITEDLSKAVYITTNYLSKEEGEANDRDNLIKAFDKEVGITDKNPDYRDLKVVFEVIEPNTSDRILINTAQISDDEDEEGNPVDDIDSIPNRDEDYDFDNDENNEDDIDIEKVKLLYFDLALRKFIIAVDDMSVNNRYPQLSLNEDGKIVYTHTKVPVEVENGNIVTYTIRVYNEGNMNGYAKEVTDDMPDGLEFLPNNEINKTYRWVMIDKDGKETDDITKAVKITTDYLSKEQGEENDRDNLIKAFDKELGLTDKNPDYRDLKVAFKVTEPNTSDRILVNTAEISDDEDENGKPVDDVDSEPDNGKEDEDDIDKEYVKVKYFDLALKKWVSQAIVTENGKTTVTETGHTGDENPEPVVKVEIKEKSLNNVVVKFAYKIKITNEGEIAGYAKEIKDYIPAGLKFVASDNPLWYEVENGVVATAQLENKLLQPGETATVDIILTWINGEDNMGQKTNVAEISKDYNDSHTPDIDSTPDNKKQGEDDIDDAPVILSIKTGSMPMYLTLTTFILVTLTGGICLIKKYVLA